MPRAPIRSTTSCLRLTRLELYSPAQLGLDHGHAYVMQAPTTSSPIWWRRWRRCTDGAWTPI